MFPTTIQNQARQNHNSFQASFMVAMTVWETSSQLVTGKKKAFMAFSRFVLVSCHTANLQTIFAVVFHMPGSFIDYIQDSRIVQESDAEHRAPPKCYMNTQEMALVSFLTYLFQLTSLLFFRLQTIVWPPVGMVILSSICIPSHGCKTTTSSTEIP